jgi:hypothetical protein
VAVLNKTMLNIWGVFPLFTVGGLCYRLAFFFLFFLILSLPFFSFCFFSVFLHNHPGSGGGIIA